MNQMALRICRVATIPRRGHEGIGRASFELAQRLGINTLYLTPARPEPVVNHAGFIHVKEVPVTNSVLPDQNRAKQSTGARLRAGFAYAGKTVSYGLFFLRSLPAMVRYRPDIVHIHSILPLFHALFGKMIGARTAVTFHGTDLYRVGDRSLFRWVLRSFDDVYYVSRAMEPLLSGCVSPDRLHYTPNGVDLDRFSPGSGLRENTILTVGVLKWQKGVDVLLAAFADFVRNYPGWKLQIAGDGPLLQKYRDEADELGLADSVEWLGQVPQDRLVDLYRSARIFVLSSLTEGFPKVILESMACGTPVVTTDVGSCREVTGNAGLVVPPNDPDLLSDAIVELAIDDNRWERMSREATVRSNLYSWDKTAEVVAVAISSFSG